MLGARGERRGLLANVTPSAMASSPDGALLGLACQDGLVALELGRPGFARVLAERGRGIPDRVWFLEDPLRLCARSPEETTVVVVATGEHRRWPAGEAPEVFRRAPGRRLGERCADRVESDLGRRALEQEGGGFEGLPAALPDGMTTSDLARGRDLTCVLRVLREPEGTTVSEHRVARRMGPRGPEPVVEELRVTDRGGAVATFSDGRVELLPPGGAEWESHLPAAHRDAGRPPQVLVGEGFRYLGWWHDAGRGRSALEVLDREPEGAARWWSGGWPRRIGPLALPVASGSQGTFVAPRSLAVLASGRTLVLVSLGLLGWPRRVQVVEPEIYQYEPGG